MEQILFLIGCVLIGISLIAEIVLLIVRSGIDNKLNMQQASSAAPAYGNFAANVNPAQTANPAAPYEAYVQYETPAPAVDHAPSFTPSASPAPSTSPVVIPSPDEKNVVLSVEQEQFVLEAIFHRNILVDACVGSGKTRTIQTLCHRLPADCQILYMTYNRLLMLDAQRKITEENVFVSDYRGFAFSMLCRQGIPVGIGDPVRAFLKAQPPLPHFDLMIVDEYQDIDAEMAGMLKLLKMHNPGLQVIAVGDWDQRIHEDPSLDVRAFMEELLGEHLSMTFTKSYRLPAGLARNLARIWGKEMEGVNEDCRYVRMRYEKALEYVLACEPQDVLCLEANTLSGQMLSEQMLPNPDSEFWRGHSMMIFQHDLAQRNPEKFNANTMYTSTTISGGINAPNSALGVNAPNLAAGVNAPNLAAGTAPNFAGGIVPQIDPTESQMIFTTFEGSKGLERPVCVVMNFWQSSWEELKAFAGPQYDTFRNAFLVAASRGSKMIIFVEDAHQEILKFQTIAAPSEGK